MGYARASEGEVLSLTSIRGIASLWVVLMHAAGMLFAVLPEALPLRPLIEAGGLAVPLFFVLSGYVLGLRYLSKLSAPTFGEVYRFWWLRFGRIYPVHLFTLLVFLAMVARRGWPSEPALSVGRFVQNLLLIQAWDYHFELSWNYPSWSISSEWFAYLLFPVLAVLFSKLTWLPAALLAVVTCGLSACTFAFEDSLVFKGLAVVLPTFTGGVLLAVACPPAGALKVSRWPELLLLLAVVLPFFVEAGAVQRALYLVIFFALIGALGVAGHRAGPFWRCPPLVYLGEISYSLYMTHAITITLLTLLTRVVPLERVQQAPVLVRLLVILGGLAVILGIAVVTYCTVERPMRRLCRRLGEDSRQPQPAVRAPEMAGACPQPQVVG